MSTPASVPVLITVKEAAQRLSVSPRSVWKLVASGALPVVKVGARSTRISTEELSNFIQRGGSPQV
jgi:excisionase family DNA binding protein